MFSATVTMSRFPVRSPLPNKVPSTRSAPAIRPSSVAATPVPLSLWVCRLMIARSRCLMCPQNHSTWSAWTLGVHHSTVFGRFRIILSTAVGPQASITASQTSTAYSGSVSEKLSGEYSKRTLVPASWGSSDLTSFVPLTAISLISSFDILKVTRRCSAEVELYRWMIALWAPATLSKVRRIRCSRDWVSTWIHTSSGIRFSSMSLRAKSNSVCEAEGKPTSISLKPVLTRRSNMSSFSSTLIGVARA